MFEPFAQTVHIFTNEYVKFSSTGGQKQCSVYLDAAVCCCLLNITQSPGISAGAVPWSQGSSVLGGSRAGAEHSSNALWFFPTESCKGTQSPQCLR